MHLKTRLRRACDACNIQKVKCDTSGPPCQSCANLNISCIYERIRRRRGPRNRQAEALKKQKLKQPDAPPVSQSDSPLASAPQPTPALDSMGTSCPASAEAICSLQTVELLLDDFFTYIHPLVPIPHEPTFRAAFERREDDSDSTFLALLASMIGFLVASFPRRPKLRLITEADRSAFPNSIALAKRCHGVAIQARGTRHLVRNPTVYDAAISYFLGVCAGYIYSMRQSRIYLTECCTMLKVYDLFRSSTIPTIPALSDTGPTSTISTTPQDQPTQHLTENKDVDLISQELGRRLFFFYVLLVLCQSRLQLGFLDIDMHIPPETPTDRYPPLPLEVDDEFLFSTHVNLQPAEWVPIMAGFNANVRVYTSYNSLMAWETAFGSDRVFDWEQQRLSLFECLQAVKSALLNVPAELSLSHTKQTISVGLAELGADESGFSHPDDHILQERRTTQYEIQKANICASQLCTRSWLVEKYWNLFGSSTRESNPHPATSHTKSECSSEMPSRRTSGASPGTSVQVLAQAQTDYIGRMMAEERRLIVNDLFALLQTVNEVNMEPTCASITGKIAQVASTLIKIHHYLKPNLPFQPSTIPKSPPSQSTTERLSPASGLPIPTAAGAEHHLHAFTNALIRLYNHFSATTDSGCIAEDVSPRVNERTVNYLDDYECDWQELTQWANLKEYQQKFAEAEGVMSEW